MFIENAKLIYYPVSLQIKSRSLLKYSIKKVYQIQSWVISGKETMLGLFNFVLNGQIISSFEKNQ